MNNISAIVLAKNEEKNIKACLEGLNWCNEIIVVNDASDDETVTIAKKFGATVYEHKLNDDFTAQRNWALENAKNTWVLFIDADERVSKELAKEIQETLEDQDNSMYGYTLQRIDVMWDRELHHGEVGDTKLLRLARKDSGKWEGKVHETWKIVGQIAEIKTPLLHYPHPGMTEFLKEINFYTDIRAKELFDKNTKVHWWSIILYPKGKFIINYFWKLGFLDSIPGLIVAILMSFHSFLVRGKLWTLWHRK